METAISRRPSTLSNVTPPAPLTGLHVLDYVDIFNLLCFADESAPATNEPSTSNSPAVGPPVLFTLWTALGRLPSPNFDRIGRPIGAAGNPFSGFNFFDHSAYYFPWVQAPDPLAKNNPRLFPPPDSWLGAMPTPTPIVEFGKRRPVSTRACRA